MDYTMADAPRALEPVDNSIVCAYNMDGGQSYLPRFADGRAGQTNTQRNTQHSAEFFFARKRRNRSTWGANPVVEGSLPAPARQLTPQARREVIQGVKPRQLGTRGFSTFA